MSKKYQVAIALALCALFMRSLAIFSWQGEKSLYYVSDSYTYRQVAINILTSGVYSMEQSPTPHPDSFRTPLYPLFLMPFVYSGISMYAVVIVQTILQAISIGGVFLLAREVFDDRVAFFATLAYALEPFTALISSQIMTEALFMSLFVPAILLLFLYLKNGGSSRLIAGTTLLALAALTRPVAFYLLLLVPVIALFRGGWGATKPALVSIGLAGFILSPWLWFLGHTLHTTSFSSLSDFDLYAYHAVYFDRWRAEHNPSVTDRLPVLDLTTINDRFDARGIGLLKSTGLHYIGTHWGEYVYYHFVRIPALFTDSGYAILANGVRSLNLNFMSVTGGVLDSYVAGHSVPTTTAIQKITIGLIGLADVLFLMATLFAIAAPLVSYRYDRDNFMVTLCGVFLILLYAMLASPIGGARLRIPLDPFIFFLAAYSLLTVRTHILYDRSAK